MVAKHEVCALERETRGLLASAVKLLTGSRSESPEVLAAVLVRQVGLMTAEIERLKHALIRIREETSDERIEQRIDECIAQGVPMYASSTRIHAKAVGYVRGIAATAIEDHESAERAFDAVVRCG